MGRCLFMRKGSVHTAPGLRLPYGFTELSYIQSSGTQYIDTGFKPNQDTRVVMDVKLLSQTTASVGIFAVRDIASPTAVNKFCAWSMKTGASIRSDYFSTASNVTSSVSIVGTRLTIDKNKNVCLFGDTALTNTAATGQCTQNLYLLCTNDGGSANYYATADLYSCQIYDNDVLVRDYVPCINPSSEVGLYDLVGKQFYGNAGTGVFTGSEVA